ncbi:MAG: hypothetical protein RLZ99_873 [Actinomycetota bacterium]|jgi:hypothetical protein
MVSSNAATVEQYLAELKEPRRSEITALLDLIRDNLPAGFIEVMAWGMIVFQVPLEVSGPTYNDQPLAAVALASQKNHISFYLSAIYASKELTAEFQSRWANSGKRLDMGKSCVRFTSLEKADLNALAWAVALFDPLELSDLYLRARQGKG